MTEKELHKLRREDLLQLLLSQSKDVAQLQSNLAAATATGKELRESNDRLKGKLDEKDEQIEHLKEKLNGKDAQIERLKERLDQKDAEIAALRESCRLELNEDGTVGVRLYEIFDAARTAAEEYLRGVMDEVRAGVAPAEMPAEETPAEAAEAVPAGEEAPEPAEAVPAAEETPEDKGALRRVLNFLQE